MTKDKFAIIDKYRIYAIGFVLLSVVLCYIILFLKGLSIKDCILGMGISFLLFFFGYIGGYFVLGLQAQNSLCPIKIFDFFCQATIYFFGIMGFWFSIMFPVISLTKSAVFDINPVPIALGFVFVANRLRKKYVVERMPRKALFSKKEINNG